MKTLALTFLGVLLGLTRVASATEPPANFAVHETPQVVPEISFQDKDGQPRTLADFSGKVVLLNIWATWCAPCRKEMPTLDRLQAELGGPDFEVIALSVDRKGPEAVRKFFDEIGIKHLALNIDTSSKAMFALGAFGLPLTLLIDRQGREVGRVVGPAEWDSLEIVAFIRDRIAAK
ncbi:MAG: TlpA family protein disulfide reductase [Mesorhizobium sp.]|nr:TlpA disulfide reductase family protein [Mesorhizobium sp.]RWH81221.1 MAG: TlpA family protein disulfide reductase [Mesorhizobium sp.]RWH85806.1 MAG: TlpA family protein disulfide reductase [Mesorhizobium sp.]RWH91063.1 MAG: TlpA family protein disulfide reductase [Mesorhizobium sp.]RWH99745.1 MAG: TlpA family protein disulfide reductase [Mesorhizobium sp.]RWI04013.1 MAG: TlpA family protein disulfide reductase [Mesorhizobium sp.]